MELQQNNESTTKIITMPLTKSTNLGQKVKMTDKEMNLQQVKIKKDPVPRIITETDKWSFVSGDLAHQHHFLNILNLENGESKKIREFIYSQIRKKIAGYKAQDNKKHLFCPEKFVVEQDILDLFHASDLQCYYCKETVMIMYSFVREPKQWTLERLINKLGHNRDNVVLACLQCNLHRRCILSERYVQTKQMSVIVKQDHPLVSTTASSSPSPNITTQESIGK